MRQLKRLLRYVKGTEDMSTVFEMRDSNDRREQLIKRLEVYTDSDWASDQVTRKSTSGCGDHGRRHEIACLQSGSGFSGIEQLRSRGNGSVGRHQGGTVVARSVDVCWLGHNVIEIKVDSSAAHAFFHRRGVGRMKHIDSRTLWLQDLIAAGGVRVKKIPRTQNLADMLTHTPSAKELEVFLPLMSLRSCSERDKELMATRQYKPVPVENSKVYSHG